ncbi:hypothetical protein NC652_041740 [Populus alba x Populus x berolinensis]|nr:hypothetical protein NC652_041740 [Populus alba x Populus x berolinensis]
MFRLSRMEYVSVSWKILQIKTSIEKLELAILMLECI